jgi:hypothetical protein
LAPEAATVLELEDDLFELVSLLPQPFEISHLASFAKSPEINPRLQRLLSASDWNSTTESPARVSTIPPDLWFAVVRELIAFVAVEERPAASQSGEAHSASGGLHWFQPLTIHLASLEALALHTRGLLTAPRQAHEEIARVVHQFVERKPPAL